MKLDNERRNTVLFSTLSYIALLLHPHRPVQNDKWFEDYLMRKRASEIGSEITVTPTLAEAPPSGNCTVKKACSQQHRQLIPFISIFIVRYGVLHLPPPSLVCFASHLLETCKYIFRWENPFHLKRMENHKLFKWLRSNVEVIAAWFTNWPGHLPCKRKK